MKKVKFEDDESKIIKEDETKTNKKNKKRAHILCSQTKRTKEQTVSKGEYN